MDMKAVLTSILMSAVILMAISSCATVAKGPLEPGELRLISVEVPDNGNLKSNVPYRITVKFQADGHPEIRRACLFWSGDGPYCVRVKDVKYGSDAYVEVEIYAPLGTNRLECFLEYIRDGKVRRTNKVIYFVTGWML
jgi:hypothetical protein